MGLSPNPQDNTLSWEVSSSEFTAPRDSGRSSLPGNTDSPPASPLIRHGSDVIATLTTVGQPWVCNPLFPLRGKTYQGQRQSDTRAWVKADEYAGVDMKVPALIPIDAPVDTATGMPALISIDGPVNTATGMPALIPSDASPTIVASNIWKLGR